MGVFKFRKFEVRNEKSAMKVNTDGVLLGAVMTLSGNERHLLDVGTGTGTVALMAAQRLSEMGNDSFFIEAPDIDGASAEEAGENFRNSPWDWHLLAHHCPLAEFSPQEKFDHIFSNPPFFTETLHSPSVRKARARHADSLPLEEIIEFAAKNLCEDGRLSLILPFEREEEASYLASGHGLYAFRCVDIQGSERKSAYRTIMEFSRDRGQDAAPSRENITINMNGKYSEQYLNIVSEFLLLDSGKL